MISPSPNPASEVALADELRLLVNEYDPNNSDWGFRKGVIWGLIGRLEALRTPTQAAGIREALEQCQAVLDTMLDPKNRGASTLHIWGQATAAERKARAALSASPLPLMTQPVITDEMVDRGGLAIDNFEMADGDPFGVLLFDFDYVVASTMPDMTGQKNEICKSLARACLEAALRGVEAPGGEMRSLTAEEDRLVHRALFDSGKLIEELPRPAAPLDRNALREQYARIIDPEAMRLSYKLGRPDAVLTAEMQARISTALAKADALLALDSNDGAGREVRLPPTGMKLIYVKRWRTLIYVPESLADEIRDTLRTALSAPNVSEAGRSPSDALSDALTADVPREEYVRLIDAIDYTLTVHGKIDADTPLHDRIRKVYRAPGSAS